MKEKQTNRLLRMISIFLIALGVTGLSAVLFMADGGTFQEKTEEEVITFALYGDTQMQRIADQVAETFMEQHHCRVEIYCYSTGEEERTQVVGQLAGGKGFDAFYVNPELLEMLLQNREVVSLEGVLQERRQEGDSFYAAALEEGKIGGVQYALPTGVMPYMIYYNQSLLEEYGIQDPQTLFRGKGWNFSAFADCLRTLGDASGGPALALSSGWETVEPLLRAEGGGFVRQEEGIVLDSQAESTAEAFGALEREGRAIFCNEEEYQKMKQQFVRGELPMIAGGLEMTRLCSNADFSWDILPWPSWDSDFQNSNFQVPLIAVGNGEHTELAEEFVSYYVSALGQKLRLENGECLMPSLNMVFYTSMGNVRFPEHSNYYFFAMENGYACENRDTSEQERRKILDLWDSCRKEDT